MKLKELKEKLNLTPSTDSWSKNEYPANPNERYSPLTYMNYDNIKDVFPKDSEGLISSLKRYLEENPEAKIVILAKLDKNGRRRGKPRLFTEPESFYYGQYTLFGCSARLSGLVEIWHNFNKGDN